jgi:hypothetical protein
LRSSYKMAVVIYVGFDLWMNGLFVAVPFTTYFKCYIG